jgi:hypothetical protein
VRRCAGQAAAAPGRRRPISSLLLSAAPRPAPQLVDEGAPGARRLAPAERGAQQRRLAAQRRGAAQQLQQRQAQKSAAQLLQAQALMKQLEAQAANDDDGEEEGGDGNADLDWDALATYEKFESYVAKQPKPSCSSGGSGSSSGARPTQERAAAAAPAASGGGKQAQVGSSKRGIRLPASAAPAGAAGGEPQVQLDRDLDELEQLIKLFELVDREARQQQQQLSRPSAAAGKQQQGADDGVDWESVERMLLGDSWDQELLLQEGRTIDMTPAGALQAAGGPQRPLPGWPAAGARRLQLRPAPMPRPPCHAPHTAGGPAGPPPPRTQGSPPPRRPPAKRPRALRPSPAAGEGEQEEVEAPWADEVSNLLLGLVGISHKKYLARPLLEPEPSEEQRAAAIWEAPFVLMVHDDSEACLLEYGNRAAMALFEMEYLDFFGTSSFALVHPDAEVQQEWIWSLRDAEERFEKYVVVPRLRLMAASGRALVARDALVFRVDSLEDEPIGQAVVFSKWQFE